MNNGWGRKSSSSGGGSLNKGHMSVSSSRLSIFGTGTGGRGGGHASTGGGATTEVGVEAESWASPMMGVEEVQQ